MLCALPRQDESWSQATLCAWPSSAGKPWNGTDLNGPIAIAVTPSGCEISGSLFGVSALYPN
jgi:hypothetical protein